MKKCLIICLIFLSFSSSAQFSPDWINRFCCFDSITPHSFSFPLGIERNLDSLFICYYEDDSVKLKIIDGITGSDLANFYYSPDSILPSFNYGGDFKACEEGYIYTCSNLVNGNFELVFNKITETFGCDSIGRVSSGMNKPTKLLAVSNTSFWIAFLTDSIRLININTDTYVINQFTFDKNSATELYPDLFLNSTGDLIVVERKLVPSSEYEIGISKINLASGSLLQSTLYSITSGISQKCFVNNDSLFIAFNESPYGRIRFVSIDLISLNAPSLNNTPTGDAYLLKNFTKNNFSDKYYIETFEKLIQVNSDHSIGFVRNLTAPSLDQYNQSPILFDSNDNPILFRSYINNTIVNEDLLAIRFDRNTGATIDSVVFNDVRNTPDIAIAQFFDQQNNLNLVFANDYDDAFILQEESQLNIIHMNSLGNFQEEFSNKTSIIYPNPTTGIFFLQNNTSSDQKIQICDFTGKLLISTNVKSSDKVDISNFNDGIYLMKIIDDRGILSTSKIIKVK